MERRMSSICAPRRCARADANVACACCVCGRVGVFFSVYARVHVRYHVCVHASSCHGHVFAHASMRVRVSHFRSPLPSQMQRKLRNYRRTSVLSGSSSLSMTSSQHRRTHPTTPRMLSRIVRLQLVHRESRRLVRLRPLRRRLGTAQPPISAGSAYVRRQRIRWTPNLL